MYNINIKILKYFIVLLVIFFVWMGVAIKTQSSNMAEPTWGALEKSGADPETIEDAIVRLIEAHNDDALAHTEPSQSIGVHKTQGVVDHPELSIVHDKLAPYSIDLNQFVADEYMIFTNFDSIDGWNGNDFDSGGIISTNILGLWLRAGGGIGRRTIVTTESVGGVNHVNFAKKMMFHTPVKVQRDTNQTIYLTVGDEKNFGFKIIDNTLYAVHDDNISESTTVISGITITDWNVYKAVFDPDAGEIYFYVNEVLKATHDTDLPTGSDSFIYRYQVVSDNATTHIIWISDLLLTIKR